MKFIIDNRTECSDAQAMKLAAEMSDRGLIPPCGTGQPNCFTMEFPFNHHVSASRLESGDLSFVIHHYNADNRIENN